MKIDVEDGVIRAIEIQGGCPGNLQAISRLVVVMRAEDGRARPPPPGRGGRKGNGGGGGKVPGPRLLHYWEAAATRAGLTSREGRRSRALSQWNPRASEAMGG